MEDSVGSADMATIFTRIIDGEIPGTFVCATTNAWRSCRSTRWPRATCWWCPSTRSTTGSTRRTVPTAHVFDVTRRIGVAQQAAFGCERVGVLIAGYEVPHMHVHVIPTNNMGR